MAGRKDFSDELYKKYDGPAKEEAIKFCQQHNYILIGGLKERGKIGDLKFKHQKTSREILVETEVKTGWHVSGRWQPEFEDIQFIKAKGENTKSDFWMLFNNSLDTIGVTEMKNVLNAPFKVVPNKYKPKDEEFYKVPIRCFDFYTNKNGRWIRVND